MRILTRPREPSFALVTETITSHHRHPMSRRPLKLAALIAILFTLGACADGGPVAPETPKFDTDSAAPNRCQVTQGVHDC
jgi:hypothetical protein